MTDPTSCAEKGCNRRPIQPAFSIASLRAIPSQRTRLLCDGFCPGTLTPECDLLRRALTTLYLLRPRGGVCVSRVGCLALSCSLAACGFTPDAGRADLPTTLEWRDVAGGVVAFQ